MSLLGIDIGSSGCKGAVFDCKGKILAKTGREYHPCCPGYGMAEMDADIFWNAFVKVARQLAEAAKTDKIEALSISSHGESFVPVDSKGNAAGRVLMNADNRAVKQAEWWGKSPGRKRIYEITGLPLHAMYSLNKIMWLKEFDAELYKKADKFVSVKDYILTQMGLPHFTDYSIASRTMAFDINTKRWSDEILNDAGIRKDKLSIPVPSAEKVGRLSPETSNILGLPQGTIVAAGGHDQPCGALGAGIVNPGEICDSAGTYECLTAVSEKAWNTAEAMAYNLNSCCHVIPERYVTLAFFPAGLASGWFLDRFCFEERQKAREEGKSVFQVLDDRIKAECAGPTGLCVTPHLAGSCNPYWDVDATGVIAGLRPNMTKYHIFKAIYEGIACELAENAKVLEKITGPFNPIKIFGGNSKSEFTLQLRADITGKTIVQLGEAEAVCLGAAMLAGIAAGIYKDADDAVNNTAASGRNFIPDAESAKSYSNQLKKYTLLYSSLDAFRKSKD